MTKEELIFQLTQMLRDGGMDEDSIGKYARKVKKLSDDEFDKLAAHNDPVGRCSRGRLKKYNMSRSEESTQSAETSHSDGVWS